jgi:hypothetical protein
MDGRDQFLCSETSCTGVPVHVPDSDEAWRHRGCLSTRFMKERRHLRVSSIRLALRDDPKKSCVYRYTAGEGLEFSHRSFTSTPYFKKWNAWLGLISARVIVTCVVHTAVRGMIGPATISDVWMPTGADATKPQVT